MYRFSLTCLTLGILMLGALLPSAALADSNLTSQDFSLDSSIFQIGTTSYRSGAQGNVQTLFRNVASGLIIATGTLSSLFIIVGGFFIIFSAGDPSKAGKGKTIIVMNVLALCLSLSAYLIINLVTWILST